MAIPAVTIIDFVGFWKINTNTYQSEYLQNYLDQFQDQFIRYIIGADAWVEVNTAGITSKQKWEDLFNGVASYLNTDCDKKLYQSGITETLYGLLYFVYVRDRMFDPTNSGNVEPLQEVSNRTNNVHNGIIAATRWNNAVAKLKYEILLFIDNYEEVSSQITSSVDNGGGAYTINIDSTFYLSNDEIVNINGIEYTTSDIVADTSFDISDAVIGLDFTDDKAIWNPYKDFTLCEELCNHLQPIGI